MPSLVPGGLGQPALPSVREKRTLVVAARPAGHPLRPPNIGAGPVSLLYMLLRWPWSRYLHLIRHRRAYNVIVLAHRGRGLAWQGHPLHSVRYASRQEAEGAADVLWRDLNVNPPDATASPLPWWRDATPELGLQE